MRRCVNYFYRYLGYMLHLANFSASHLTVGLSHTAPPSGAPAPVYQLPPPLPFSPVTSGYLEKLSADMLIPNAQIRLLDCIGQGIFSYVSFCRIKKFHSWSYN